MYYCDWNMVIGADIQILQSVGNSGTPISFALNIRLSTSAANYTYFLAFPAEADHWLGLILRFCYRVQRRDHLAICATEERGLVLKRKLKIYVGSRQKCACCYSLLKNNQDKNVLIRHNSSEFYEFILVFYPT